MGNFDKCYDKRAYVFNTKAVNRYLPLKAAIRAYCHPLRASIIDELRKGEVKAVTEIYVKLRIDQSVASQHLRELRKAKLVSCEKFGKERHYSVNEKILKSLDLALLVFNQSKS